MSDKDILEEFNNAISHLDKAIADMRKAPKGFSSGFKLLELIDQADELERVRNTLKRSKDD